MCIRDRFKPHLDLRERYTPGNTECEWQSSTDDDSVLSAEEAVTLLYSTTNCMSLKQSFSMSWESL